MLETIPREGIRFEKRPFRNELQNIRQAINHRCGFVYNMIDSQHSIEKVRFLEAMTYLNIVNWEGTVEKIETFYMETRFTTLKSIMSESEKRRLAIITITDMEHSLDSEVISNFMYNNGFRKMPVLQEEMKQSPSHKLYITKKKNSTFVITSQELSWENLYKTLVMHWEWHKEDMLSPNETYKNLLYGFMNKDLNTVNEMLNELVWHNEDLQKEQIRLAAMNLKFNKEQALKSKEEEITRIRTRMEETVRTYETYDKMFRQANEEYECIRCKEDNIDIDALTEFLYNSEYFTVGSCLSDIGLYYRTPIIDYDEQLAEKQKAYRDKKEQDILDIFIKHRNTYRLWIHAEVHLSSSYGENSDERMYVISNDRVLTEGNRSYYGHPHLNEYTCVGNHPEEIYPFMDQGNFIGAINQITSMVFNLNFADGPVVNTLMAHLAHIEQARYWENTETHTFMTTDEVIAEIKEKENGTTETD